MSLTKKKGQSAIEYLTTYGWAILAIVIVGAVVMNYLGGTCPEKATGLTQGDVIVDEWAFQDDGDFQVAITNQGHQETINITEVQVTGETWNGGSEIGFGETDRVEITNAHDLSSGCYNEQINITYDVGTIEDKRISGTLQGRY